MADPDAEITIEANGKSYSVFYGNKAFRLIERELGKPIVQLNDQSLDELTTVIWAGLTIHQPGITLDEVDTIIDEIGYAKMGDIVKAGLAKALPEAAEEPALGNSNRAARRAVAANGTGKAS